MFATLPLLLAALATPGDTATAHTPHYRPTFEVRRASGPIRLDGVLDDEAWADAVVATGFTEIEPTFGAAAPVRTLVRMTYDQDNLYLAFDARGDGSPVRANLSQRDHLGNDDWVGVFLDPFGTGDWAYFIGATPLGVQFDARWQNGNPDTGLDLVFDAEARVEEDGFVVEMAIPFSSLRFPRQVTEWKVNFFRNHARTHRHQVLWAMIDPDDACLICQFATLTGMEGIEPGGGTEVIPSLVASQAGRLESAGFANDNPTAAMGVTLRHPFSSGWTAEATLNPDFSQIEADASQVDVNSPFALSYPERRPFFQEGSDLFQTMIPAVYTRSVNAPSGAAKLIGRTGDLNVAFLSAVDERSPQLVPFEERSSFVDRDRSLSNVLRVRQGLDQDAYVGALITDRRYEGGGAGTLAAVDTRLAFGSNVRLNAQLAMSRTEEPMDTSLSRSFAEQRLDGHTAAFDGEVFTGHAAVMSLSRETFEQSQTIRAQEFSPTFRADNGFVTRTGYRRLELSSNRTWRPEHATVSRIHLGASLARDWRSDGGIDRSRAGASLSTSLAHQSDGWVSVNMSEEVFAGSAFTGLWTLATGFSSTPTAAISFGARGQVARDIYRSHTAPAAGMARSASAWVRVQPTGRLEVHPSLTFATMDGDDGEYYRGTISRVAARFQFTRETVLRLNLEHNGFDESYLIEPLILYRLNPFTVAYLGSTFRMGGTERTLEDRQLFMKVQVLLRP